MKNYVTTILAWMLFLVWWIINAFIIARFLAPYIFGIVLKYGNALDKEVVVAIKFGVSCLVIFFILLINIYLFTKTAMGIKCKYWFLNNNKAIFGPRNYTYFSPSFPGCTLERNYGTSFAWRTLLRALS
jgi:hypothetical protein